MIGSPRIRMVALLSVVPLLTHHWSNADDWPQWRGPNRDNVSRETGLLTEWPEGGPPLVWKATGLGEGIASVAVADGKVFTLGYHDEQEVVTAIDVETGKSVWSSPIGPSPSASPFTSCGGRAAIRRDSSSSSPIARRCVIGKSRSVCRTISHRWASSRQASCGVDTRRLRI